MKHTIVLPDLGQTTDEARISKWLKQPGDKVALGEPLVQVETDKATVEVEAHSGGYVRELLVAEGLTAPVMAPIAIITDTARESYEQSPAAVPAAVHVPVVSPAESRRASSPAIQAVPAARMLARQAGVDLMQIAGSGAGGLILTTDVEQFLRERPGTESPETRARAAMAELVTRSKNEIPDFQVEADLEMSRAETWRVAWNLTHPALQASLNDILVLAASRTLAASPAFQYRYAEGSYEKGPCADILLIVSVEERLVLVPVVLPSAGQEELLQTIRATVAQAREGKLAHRDANRQPSVCLSNLGMFNVKRFVAVIPPGCTAVLAVGKVRQAPVVRDGRIDVETICTVTLSSDHRVVDGIAAAKFLDLLQTHLNSL